MGSSQSVPSTSEITYSPSHASNVKEYKASTKNGPKTQPMEQTNPISNTVENEGSIADSESSVVTTESDYSSDEEEDFDFDSNEEYEAERRLILEEASKLREMAAFYMHPEAPVASDATACARCYFTRYSAPASEELEDEEERKRILADAQNLKELAGFYMHPEKPVVSNDATVCGRNYFSRPSAPEYDEEDVEERERILEEMKQLKTTAEWYMHPEKPVVVDATACGRNYFTRASAPVTEHEDERQLILEEMKQLKTTAEWYMHPEKPVAVDSTACGRNYFTRPSAPEYEDDDEVEEERERILEEMKQLKTTAEWYMHPEKPVTVDSTACGRNYFTRPSAPIETEEMADERERILEEMKQLKTTAEWYMHPEKPVAVDSTACGRNYFTRPSAPEYEDEDMDDERERILDEMKQLKTTAEWYMHPEKPVSVDPTACGRNYFSRPSTIDDNAGAVSWETSDELHFSLDFESNYSGEREEEQKRVLAEASQLKEVASWYLEPEKPVKVDPAAFGRNYFTRPSATEQEDDTEERDLILAELDELKKVADWYMHPEKPVTVYATTCGRNFFNRPSAPEQEDEEVTKERDEVLAEAAELRRVAEWYMHPEKPVTVYATVCGRNFFSRPSAPDYDEEMEEERQRILAEAKELKEVASWYLSPDQPVKTDGLATARNFFTRPSAPEYDDEDLEEERERILAEAKELKEVAIWYLNPEQPVKTDGLATARNFFTRPSAPEYDDEDLEEERERILAEAKELKEVASWYLQPEKPVTVHGAACGRNYFTRPSAVQVTEEEERQRILADAMELKKLAVDYMHPEKPVVSSSINCSRNYFDRPSAKGHADYIHTEGYANHSHIHGDYVHEGFHDHDYHYHDHYHHDDISHQSFQSQSDHFEMDEDGLHGFRESINAFRESVVGVHDPEHIPIIKEEGDGKEGNLSRSPSSIMLFDAQATI